MSLSSRLLLVYQLRRARARNGSRRRLAHWKPTNPRSHSPPGIEFGYMLDVLRSMADSAADIVGTALEKLQTHTVQLLVTCNY